MKFLLLQLIRSHLNKRGSNVLSYCYASLLTTYIYICYIDMYFLHYGWQCEQAVYPRCSASDLEIDIELFLRYLQPAA